MHGHEKVENTDAVLLPHVTEAGAEVQREGRIGCRSTVYPFLALGFRTVMRGLWQSRVTS